MHLGAVFFVVCPAQYVCSLYLYFFSFSLVRKSRFSF